MSDMSSIQELLEVTARIEERQRISSIDSLYLLTLPLTISLAGITVTVVTRLLPAITIDIWQIVLVVVGIALIPYVLYCRAIYRESTEMRLKALDRTIHDMVVLLAASVSVGNVLLIQKVFSLNPSSRFSLLVGLGTGGVYLAFWISAHLTHRYVVDAFRRRIISSSEFKKLAEEYSKRKEDSYEHFFRGISFCLAAPAAMITDNLWLGLLILVAIAIGLAILMVFVYEKFFWRKIVHDVLKNLIQQ